MYLPPVISEFPWGCTHPHNHLHMQRRLTGAHSKGMFYTWVMKLLALVKKKSRQPWLLVAVNLPRMGIKGVEAVRDGSVSSNRWSKPNTFTTQNCFRVDWMTNRKSSNGKQYMVLYLVVRPVWCVSYYTKKCSDSFSPQKNDLEEIKLHIAKVRRPSQASGALRIPPGVSWATGQCKVAWRGICCPAFYAGNQWRSQGRQWEGFQRAHEASESQWGISSPYGCQQQPTSMSILELHVCVVGG